MRLIPGIALMLYLFPLAAVPALAKGSEMPGAVKQESRRDLQGHPLPPGATARLGSVRFHHEGDIIAMAFSPELP